MASQTVTSYCCDRCGTKINYSGENSKIGLEKENLYFRVCFISSPDSRVDLCISCLKHLVTKAQKEIAIK